MQVGDGLQDLEVEMSTLGLVLRTKREQLGLSQIEAAELAGISNSFLCQLESGARRGNSVVTVAKLADAYGIDVAVLVSAQGQGGDDVER
jgi:transcriptional regulator with XRE-family HTH domain